MEKDMQRLQFDKESALKELDFVTKTYKNKKEKYKLQILEKDRLLSESKGRHAKELEEIVKNFEIKVSDLTTQLEESK